MKKLLFIFTVLFLSHLKIYSQTWQWAREENAGPEGYGVACDNAGNVFLAGITFGPAVIGSYTNSSTGTSGVIVKYDANGNLLWANFVPGCTAYNVDCDAAGNAFLCGYFSNTLVIGSQTLVAAGGADIFVIKYSPTGSVLWAASTGGSGGDLSNCVNVDASGNVIVSGYIGAGSFTFGSSSISNSSGNKYFIGKFSNNGVPIWGLCGASGASTSNYVCSDAVGDIYLTGPFSSTSSIGSGTYVANGSFEFYLTKYTAAGLPVWTVVGGGPQNDIGYCVKVHPSGDVFVSGAYTSPTFTLSTATLTNAGSNDAFLARFSNTGSLLWAINGGGTGNEIGFSIAPHAGGVYMAGSIGTTSCVIGTATLNPPNGSDNMFLCGVDNSGSVVYSEAINGGGDDVMALDMYNGCSLYLGGDILTPTLTLGAFTLTHTSSEVFFIAKFNTGINSPILGLSPSYTLCQGNTMTLTASGASTYTWDNGPNTSNYVISPANTSTYVVSGTSAAGCSTKSVVTVVVTPGAVTLSVLSSTPFCTGNTATLSIAGASTFSWNVGATSPSILVSPSITSVYNVSGNLSNGCFYNNSYTLNVIPTSPLSLNTNQATICKGNTLTLIANGANLYIWNTGSQQFSISVSPITTSTYVVTGTNTTNGCVTKASVQVSVSACVGIEETNSDSNLSIYPNPSKGDLYIKANISLKGATITVRNLQAEIVYSNKIVNETELLSGLLPGIYLISIEREGIIEFSKKLIVE